MSLFHPFLPLQPGAMRGDESLGLKKQIPAIVHGTEKGRVLDHKDATDAHLKEAGIPVSYTNVFWGGRIEITPSEISPVIYREWHQKHRGQPAGAPTD